MRTRAIGIHTCSAEGFSAPRMRVMTSMAVRDDVQSGESYYVREIKYLKRMMDAAGCGVPVFCAVDEILKGTNKKERLAASEAVLRYLSDGGIKKQNPGELHIDFTENYA